MNKTAQDNEDNFPQEVVKTVRRNSCVDDLLKSVPSTQQSVRLTSDQTKLLKEGGFRLTKFASNSREVLQSLPPDVRANPLLDFNLDQLPFERALGVYWEAQSDTFKFKAAQTEKPSTKHGILSVVSSLFDPLGFLSSFVFSAKILLQELWRDKLHWGREIPKTLPLAVAALVGRVTTCHHYKHSKVFQESVLWNPIIIQLYNFADASRHGYAAVSNLRFVEEKGAIICSFVMGKTRNAPIRE